MLAAEEGWGETFAKAAYRHWFLEGVALCTEDSLEPVIGEAGQDASRVIGEASSDRIAEKLESETERARALGIFGSPTFVAGKEIFWGDDRLEEALEWALGNA